MTITLAGAYWLGFATPFLILGIVALIAMITEAFPPKRRGIHHH